MTYLNYKKRKNGFPEVTTEVIAPEKPIKQTEDAKVKQSADSLPYYTEKNNAGTVSAPRKTNPTDPLGIYKTPPTSDKDTTKTAEPLKELPEPAEEIDLSQDDRYKVTKRAIPYDPADSWLDGKVYTPENGTQKYVEMQGNLREYLERTEREITELEEKHDSRLKNDGYVSRRLGQIDKVNGMIDRYYDFYDRFKDNMSWWKTSAEVEDELAFLRSEKNALQSLQTRLTEPKENIGYQTLLYRPSDGQPQMQMLSHTASSPQPSLPTTTGTSTAGAPTTTKASTAAQPTTSAAGGKTNPSSPSTASATATIQTATKNTPYTPPNQTQADSFIYWLNRGVDTYNFRDVEMMIPKLDAFVGTLVKEYEERNGKDEFGEKDGEYYVSTTLNHIVNTRTGQIDKAISMIDWYIDYITNNHDEVNEVYGGEEIDEILAKLRGLRSDLSKEKVELQVEIVVRKLYSSEGEYLAYNNYDEAVKLLNQGVEEIIRLTDLLKDPKYLYANSDYPEDVALREEKKLIEEQIAAWNKRLEPLEKALTSVNTDNFRDNVQKMIDEGATYEDLVSMLEKIEKNINACQRACNWAKGKNNQGRRNTFQALVNKYTNDKQILLAQMSYMKDIEYTQYRKASDWNQLSKAKVPELQNEPQIRAFLKNNVNNPYYYINDTFGMRKYYKVQSKSGSDFNANGQLPNAHRYGGLMYTERRPTGEFEVYDHMTEEEIKTYNYIYHKFGDEKADEYLDSLINKKNYYISVEGTVRDYEDGLNYRWGLVDASDDNFLEKMANSIGVGMTRFGINIAQLFSSEPIPPTKNEYRYEITLSQSKGFTNFLCKTLENIGQKIPSRLLDSLTSALGVGVVGKAVSVASSASEVYRMAQLEGYNDVQACNYATLIGASELCFGIIAEKVNDAASVNSKAVSQRVIESAGEKIATVDYILKKVSEELQTWVISGTEEAIKNLLRPIFEEWIFDETMSKADFETMVTDYLITALTELAL